MVDGLLHLVKTNTKAVEKIETYCRKIETLFASCQEKGNTFRIVPKKNETFSHLFKKKWKQKVKPCSKVWKNFCKFPNKIEFISFTLKFLVFS